MSALANALTILAFCAATVGATGFRTGKDGFAPEPHAIALFVSGSIACLVLGVLLRIGRRRKRVEGGPLDVLNTIPQLERLVAETRALREARKRLSRKQIIEMISSIESGALFDLTATHEEIASRLGFNEYARIWEGVALGERLLARAWSLATDDCLEESREEIEHALAGFESALERARETPG